MTLSTMGLATPLNIWTLSITTFLIMTFCLTTLSIMGIAGHPA